MSPDKTNSYYPVGAYSYIDQMKQTTANFGNGSKIVLPVISPQETITPVIKTGKETMVKHYK
jgi:hypothetical protein